MSSDIIFTKETLDFYFKELAKEYKRLNGSKMKAEMQYTPLTGPRCIALTQIKQRIIMPFSVMMLISI